MENYTTKGNNDTVVNQMEAWLVPLAAQNREAQDVISADPYLGKFKEATTAYIEFMNEMYSNAHPNVQREGRGVLHLEAEKYIGQFSWCERNIPFDVMPVSFEDREILVKLSCNGMNSAIYVPRNWYAAESDFRKNFEAWILEQNRKTEKEEELESLEAQISHQFEWLQINLNLDDLGEGDSPLVTAEDVEKVLETKVGLSLTLESYTLHWIIELLFEYGQVNESPLRRDNIRTLLIQPILDSTVEDQVIKMTGNAYVDLLNSLFYSDNT